MTLRLHIMTSYLTSYCAQNGQIFTIKKTLMYKLNSGESLDAIAFAISNTQCVCILRDLEYRESACCAVVTSLVMS